MWAKRPSPSMCTEHAFFGLPSTWQAHDVCCWQSALKCFSVQTRTHKNNVHLPLSIRHTEPAQQHMVCGTGVLATLWQLGKGFTFWKCWQGLGSCWIASKGQRASKGGGGGGAVGEMEKEQMENRHIQRFCNMRYVLFRAATNDYVVIFLPHSYPTSLTGGYTPWTGLLQSIIHIHSESQIDLNAYSFGLWEEKTHMHKGKTCKLDTKWPEPQCKPAALLAAMHYH